MTDVAYATTHELASDRLRWSIALITRLVHRGRTEGWLAGSARPPEQLPDPDAIAASITSRLAATPQTPERMPMQWLASQLALTGHELDVLWLLASVELSPAIARLVQTFGSAECPDLTVQLVQQLAVVSPASLERLHELRLIELATEARLPSHRRWIRASDRTVELAGGSLDLDRTLAACCTIVAADELAAHADELPAALLRAVEATPSPLIVLVGAEGSGRTTTAARVAARTGRHTLQVRCPGLDREPREMPRQLRAIARECRLFDLVPVLCGAESLGDDGVQLLDRELLRRVDGPVIVTATPDRRWQVSRPVVVHRMGGSSSAARARIWRTVLPGVHHDVVEAAANQYTTTPGAIVAAAASAITRAGEPSRVTLEDVHEGLRGHLDDRLGGLATRITCTQRWQDIVLPVDQFEQLAELVARVRHRDQVLDSWGFADKVGRGLGVAALLSGPPGTGKTMVAGLIARELGLDLYQVDLSRVVSKYIGETEANLAKVFDAAESGHAILLFDEADALFARRSEVKSSNDRYANLEVNYLLQRIEQFRGICLLTTNHETAIDEAFRRRLAIHVRFPVPDERHRDALWRAMIPERAHVDELDFDRLSHAFAMTGGYIKNAALRAAYLAADANSPITTDHLWRAARAEYEAMGKLAFVAG